MHIVISGAGSGLGRELTELLSRNNKVIALVHTEDQFDIFDAQIDSIVCDVTSDEDINAVIALLGDQVIDIIIHCAGILDLGVIMDTPVGRIKEIFDVNIHGIHRLNRALLPTLIKAGGKIVIVGSDSGLVHFPLSTAYSMSKFALEAYADGLNEELIDLGVRIVLLEPGNFSSSILRKAYDRVDTQGGSSHHVLGKRVTDMYGGREQAIRNFERSRPVREMAEEVRKILDENEPLPRYLITTYEETEYVISELMDKIAGLNKSSDKPLSENKLHKILDFSLGL